MRLLETLKNFSRPKKVDMKGNQSDSEESEEWEEVETPEEAAEILHSTMFEFAGAIYKLCLSDEKKNPAKYAGKLLPSAKILVVTVMMKCWDNNKGRLAEHYVNHVLNWKKHIDDRNEDFFLNNTEIYTAFDGRKPPPEDIEFFKDLWRPNSTFALKKDEKETVFTYFDIMLHYCAEWKRMKNYTAIWEKK